MRALKADMHSARAYRDPGPSIATRLDSAGLDDWLAGFVAGDGSFGIRDGAVRLTIKLRADDAPLLRGLMAATGAGKVSGPYDNPGSNPVVGWNVCGKSDLEAMVDRLDGRVPGRKAAEFEVWRRAVAAKADVSLPRQKRRAQRERVLGAMRRCAAELGRLPGPTEYARWRLHNDPRAPSFVTAYRLFPGGWSEIHAALA